MYFFLGATHRCFVAFSNLHYLVITLDIKGILIMDINILYV